MKEPRKIRRELAAFLANIAQETSGGWNDAPGGYYKWGLYFIEENNKEMGIIIPMLLRSTTLR
jgi:hypothetical protein